MSDLSFHHISEEFLLDHMDEIPTLPEVTYEVIALAQNPNARINDIKRIIMTDPILAAKIMKTANSAVFARRTPAKTLENAMIMLGMQQLIQLCITHSYASTAKQWNVQHLDSNQVWRHSIASAFLAKTIEVRDQIKFKVTVDIYLTGLMHNLGWIVLDHLFPDIVAKGIEEWEHSKLWSTELEELYFGMTHAEVGAIILREWKMPAELVNIVRYHEDPRQGGDLYGQCSLVLMSSVLSPFPFELQQPVLNLPKFFTKDLEYPQGVEMIPLLRRKYKDSIDYSKNITEIMAQWV